LADLTPLPTDDCDRTGHPIEPVTEQVVMRLRKAFVAFDHQDRRAEASLAFPQPAE
jgi:hypothetical protein